MRNLGFLLATAAGLGLVGCGDDGSVMRTGDGSTPRPDSGMMSPDGGGTIILPDGGGTTDTGTTPQTDSGSGGTDAGSTDGICGSATDPSTIEPLPATCLPRCSQQTLSAIQGCGMEDTECQQSAIDADTTPPARYNVGGPEPLEIDCGSCLNLQNLSCIAEICPDELNALFACLNEAASPSNPQPDPATACPDENMTLEACIDADEETFSSCAGSRGIMCFP